MAVRLWFQADQYNFDCLQIFLSRPGFAGQCCLVQWRRRRRKAGPGIAADVRGADPDDAVLQKKKTHLQRVSRVGTSPDLFGAIFFILFLDQKYQE